MLLRPIGRYSHLLITNQCFKAAETFYVKTPRILSPVLNMIVSCKEVRPVQIDPALTGFQMGLEVSNALEKRQSKRRTRILYVPFGELEQAPV